MNYSLSVEHKIPGIIMKICMLTTVHPPFDTRIFHKEAKSLLKANYEVTIVAPYDYKDCKKINEINVITVKKPESTILHPITMFRVLVNGFKQDCDVYHCFEPGSLFLCSILKILKNKPVIYDGHEHYPTLISENVIFPNLSRPFIYKLSDLFEKKLIKFADAIITVTEPLAEMYNSNYSGDVVLVENYPIPDLFNRGETGNIKGIEPRDIVIGRFGGMHRLVGIVEIIKAFKTMRNSTEKCVKLILIGPTYPQSYRKTLEEEIGDCKEIILMGPVKYEDVPKYYKLIDFSVVLGYPTTNNEIGISVKLLESMISGIPVIASYGTDKQIVQKLNCGIPIVDNSVGEIAKAMKTLVENDELRKKLGANGKQAAIEKYNWNQSCNRLIQLYKKITCYCGNPQS